MKVLIIANYSENAGGIAVQVKLLYKKLISEGIQCDIFSTKGSIFSRIIMPFKLLCYGREYDVFHIHACSYRGFLPAMIGIPCGRILQKKLILTYHGGDAESFFIKRTSLVKSLLTKTDHNIVLSQFLSRVFDKYGIQCKIIPNIIELPNKERVVRTLVKPDFVCIRSFTPTYNIDCLIKAFQIIKHSHPEATLTLIGDGPLRNELMNLVTDNSIKGVTFTGLVKNDEIYNYLGKVSIMVSPSKFDNMPVSILEGFNAGLIVIASRVGGVPYMVRDGVNGFLFENGSVEDLVSKMNLALQIDPKPIVSAAYESLYDYSWESCKGKLFSLYMA